MENNENNEIRYKIYPFLLFFLAIVFIVIVFPNVYLSLKYLFSPKKIPVINGLLYDEWAKRPLGAGVQVEAEWLESVGTSGGGMRRVYKEYRTVTNEKGEFVLPSVWKPYPYGLPPLFVRGYGGLRVRVLSLDYNAEEALFEAPDIVRIKITAREFTDGNEVIKKLEDIPLDSIDMRNELVKLFENRYTIQSLMDDRLYDLLRYYGSARLFEKARIVFLELKKRDPSLYPENVDDKIAFLKQQADSEAKFLQEYLKRR